MTERSLLWSDSTGDGGPYSRDELRLLTTSLAGGPSGDQGVFEGQLNGLAVTTNGADSVDVASGRAIVNGTVYENDAAQNLAISRPVSGTTGVLVGLRKDWAAQTVRLFVTKSVDGMATIPALTQVDGTTWEIPLASCTITTAGVIGGITNLRKYVPQGDVRQYSGTYTGTGATQTIIVGVHPRLVLISIPGPFPSFAIATAGPIVGLGGASNKTPAVTSSIATIPQITGSGGGGFIVGGSNSGDLSQSGKVAQWTVIGAVY